MRPQYRTFTALTNDDNGIAETQSAAGAGDLTLDGVLVVDGVATLDYAQIITITSDADDSGLTFTVVGTDANGNDQTESFSGANTGAADSTLYFLTVSQISVDGATAGNVIAGALSANGAVSSIITADWRQRRFNAGIGLDYASGSTGTVTVEHAFSNPNETDLVDIIWHQTTGLTGITSTNEGNIQFPVQSVRLKATTAVVGTITMTYIQAGA